MSSLNAFPLKFRVYDNFYVLFQFWHQQDSNSTFKGSIGYVTS